MPETDVLRAGVVGVGAMGEHHARVYDELQRSDLVGVTDADPDRAAAIADRYSTTAVDLDALLDRADIVSIAVPTEGHFDLATRCIEAGVDLLVEKPLVADPERGRDLLERVRSADVTLQVGHIERHNPVVQTLGEILRDLDVIAFEAARLGPTPDREIRDSAVIDLMIHDLDVLCSLIDRPVEAVDAIGTAQGRHATATLEFADGPIGTVTASRVTQQKQRRLTITAEEAYVTADYIEQSIEIHRQSAPEYVTENGGVRYRHESVVENPAVETGEPLRNQLEAFIAACAGEQEPAVTGAEGLRSLELAREVNEAAFGTARKQVRIER